MLGKPRSSEIRSSESRQSEFALKKREQNGADVSDAAAAAVAARSLNAL